VNIVLVYYVMLLWLYGKTQGRRQRGGQWCPSRHLKSVPPISRLPPWLLHTSNTVFKKVPPLLVFDPLSVFCPHLLLNPGAGPGKTALNVCCLSTDNYCKNSGWIRFKLTHRDLAMLSRYAIVGETHRPTIVHHINNAYLQQVRNTFKVYKTV